MDANLSEGYPITGDAGCGKADLPPSVFPNFFVRDFLWANKPEFFDVIWAEANL